MILVKALHCEIYDVSIFVYGGGFSVSRILTCDSPGSYYSKRFRPLCSGGPLRAFYYRSKKNPAQALLQGIEDLNSLEQHRLILDLSLF